MRIAATMLASCALLCAASPPPFSEYEVKAAMLVNFARFAEWPPAAFSNPKQPLVIGVLGPDPFGPMLDEVAREKSIGGRAVVVRRLESWPAAEPVHILFLSKTDKRRMKPLLSAMSSQPVLTVSDQEGFTGQGGVIGFTLDDGKVKFEVNLAAAEQAGVTLSSKLLRLAIRTLPATAKGGA